MTNQRAWHLFKLYVNKQATPDEQSEFLQWVEEADEDEVQELMGQGWHDFRPQHAPFTTSDRDNMLGAVFNSSTIIKRSSFWPRMAVAASITVIIGAISMIYFNRHKNHNQQQLAHNDIVSGHNGATLMLSNGKKIQLGNAADGRLAEEAGVEVTKTQNGQLEYALKTNEINDKINTLSTAKGETYQVKLPDGTRVWLNSASSLTYTTSLNDKGKRKVKLTGEGYFEVAKDKVHPFVVQTGTQEVEVLGTHFNINSYNDEAAVATTLLEGSVKVTSGHAEQIIKPGYQVLNNGDLKVQLADTDQITDWKNGDFNLNRVDFRVAMRKIARWYDVDIVYNQSVPEGIKSGGWISRRKPLSDILAFIERSGQVHFNVEGRKVYVSK